MTPEAVLLIALGAHQFAVTLHVHPSVQAAEIACRKQYDALPVAPIDGCAVVRNGRCTVHVAAPQSWADRAALVRLGEELAHCAGARH